MALFKILKGSGNLPTAKTEGWAYVKKINDEAAEFYVDYDANTRLQVGKQYNVVSATEDGIVPKFDAADGRIDSNSSDWVLTNNNGSLGWYRLPTNAFKNDNTNTTYTLSGAASGDTWVTTLTGSDNATTTSTVPAASTTAAGLMTSTMVAKLNSIAEGATANKGDITQVTAGDGLTGGATSGNATLSANLGAGLVFDANKKIAANTSYTSANKNYAVKTDSNGALYVNVPWSDTDTHHVTRIYTGASGATAHATSPVSNPYITVTDNNVYRTQVQLKGSGATSVSADDGVITISSTNTTYSAFKGASASENGGTGLVPAPLKGQEGYYLRGDGVWFNLTGMDESVQNTFGALQKAWKEADSSLKDTLTTLINGKAQTNHASSGTSYGISTASLYGHTMASSTTPKASAATAAVGSETAKFARGDHVHPLTVANSWSGGVTAGPKIKTTINGVDGTAVAIPKATASVSGVVIVGDQTFGGIKRFSQVDINATYHLGSFYNYGNGCLIDIGPAKSSTMVAIHITGNSYSSSDAPINSLYQVYDYGSGTTMNYSGISIGQDLGAMKVYRYNDRLYAHIVQKTSYSTLNITLYTNKAGLTPTVTNAVAQATGYTDLVTITPSRPPLADSGVTAGSYGPSANASPAHGGTFSVPYITFDAKGRATAASTKTITLPTYTIGNATITIKAGTGLKTGGSFTTNQTSAGTITLDHSNSITAGSVGAAQSPSHGGTFAIPKITYDAQGHITEATTVNITLPGDNNTDTKVTQTVTTSNAAYPLLLAPNGQTATTTTTSYFDSGVTLNPSTNTIAANISGTAAQLTSISETDKASNSDVWRRIWMGWSNNTTGRPAYDDRFAIQTSTGTLKAPIFLGDLTGTATKATQDGNGNVITSTYLPLAGGTLTGMLGVPGITQTEKYQIQPEGTAAGWYRCAEFTRPNSLSPFLILSIGRSYYSPQNEGYVFCITLGYNGDVNISQIAGHTGGHLLPKIRVDYINSGKAYVDFYIESNGTASYKNTWYVGGYGNATLFTPYIVTAASGTTYEFTTVKGMKNDGNIYGTLKGNADTATKAIQDGSGNVITAKYVTLDTAQAISGAKTFSKTITLSDQNYISVSDRAYIFTKYSDFQYSSLTPSNTSGDENFMKAALKAMCTKYPGFTQPIFLGNLGPNSQGPMYGSIYGTSTVNSTTGLPQYSTFWFSNLNGNLGIFGTNNYNYYYRTVLDSSNYTSYTDSRYVNVTGDTMTGTLNMNNNSISNIGDLGFADPGVNEGITWSGGNGWWIYESPDDLSNAAGNLQFVHGSTRRLTINKDGYVDINARLVVRGNGSSYNEGIRILPASNGWSNVFFSADTTLSDTHDGGWLIGRRGAVGAVAGAIGDFTIEEQNSNGSNLTIHKNSGGATLQGTLKVTNGNIHVNSTAGNGTGLGLHSTSAPTVYGIHMSTTANYGKFGDVQSDWATYFNMNAVGQRGWIYRAGSTNVASISANGIGAFKGITTANRSNSEGTYSTSGLEIREYNYAGAGTDSWGQAPRLSFHWSGKVAAQIGLASNGYLYTAPSTGTTFYKLVYESGTWGIDISGNAATASALKGISSSSAVPLTDPGAGMVKYYYNVNNGLTGNMPTTNNANGILYLNTHSGEYGYQLGFSSNGHIYYRHKNGSAFTTSTAWNTILDSGNYTDYTDSRYVNVSGDTMTGKLQVNAPIFGYNYTNSNNAAAFIFDKPSSNYTGIGACSESDTIYFGACDANGSWVTSYRQKWKFNGSLVVGGGDDNCNIVPWTNNYSTIGTESLKWWKIYATNIYGDKVYGAVWNDYAEYRSQFENISAGRVAYCKNDGKLRITTERLQRFEGVVSDTFGFAIGETDNAKTPLAVSGRVLVYTYEPRDIFNSGDCVCAAPNGTVSKMTREEIVTYPDRIVGIVSEIPDYETWGTGEVPVDGRIWIKVK